ncbi:MAG: fumarate hydratase [Chloroflexi bacterium]|nr:fumarate hydratase [Chloroflexota bacterium]
MSTVRAIAAERVADEVARLFQEANYDLPQDVFTALVQARAAEEAPLARSILDQILENARVASSERMALCQDCGTSVVFLELGQDVHITGGYLYDAITEGVGRAYREGFLRSSMVLQPFSARRNTGNNTPPVIHTELVPGDRLRITVMPKGGGCENMSQMKILLPGAGRAGMADFVVQAVEEAGGNPCPPLIVGVGIGGTAEHCMALAKRALLRPVGEPHPDPEVAQFEAELLEAVNATGIGPQAVGGRTTALAVHVGTFPTHIASLPVAVNLQCHSARTKSVVL